MTQNIKKVPDIDKNSRKIVGEVTNLRKNTYYGANYLDMNRQKIDRIERLKKNLEE